MYWQDYEKHCRNALRAYGWSAEILTDAADYGVDIIAKTRAGDVIAAIQCKKRADGSLGVQAVQEVYAGKAFYDATHAVVVTDAQYTQNARRQADKLGVWLLSHTDLHHLGRILRN